MYKVNSENESIIKLSVVKFLIVKDLFLIPVPSKLVGVFSINSNHIADLYEIILNISVFLFNL